MTPSSDYWIKRAKWLTQALIISATLNVGLFSTFIYMALRDKYRPLTLELKPASGRTQVTPHLGLQELLVQYQSQSFQELIDKLINCDHVEAGYTKRDLALAALVAFHHFNLERALGGLSLQRRVVVFRDPKSLDKLELTIFPALADYQYQAIIQYAKTEKWPLTAHGLFLALKNSKPPYDPSLLDALSLTPQFYFTSTLFSKTGFPLRKEQIAALLASGTWEIAQEMTEQLRATSAFDPQRRRQLLIRLMAERSQLAAALLLQTDPSFTFKRFDDAQMLAFLDLLGPRTPAPFAKALLASPRSDSVWKRAATILYTQGGELLPEPYDHRAVLAKFIYGNAPVPVQQPAVQTLQTAQKSHTVQDGESLWKIARLYKVSPEEIKKLNQLEHERLRVGQQLKIP